MGEKKSTTLVLVGKSGNGKSSTGNSILGCKTFKAARSLSSTAKHCEMISTHGKDGRVLSVIDTPGLFDTKTSQQEFREEIENFIDLAKDGLHGVLLVLSLGRFTAEEAAVLDCLQIIFGPNIANYVVVVFTGGDLLENNEFEELMDSSPKELKDFLHRCDDRKILFNNKSNSPQEKEKQVHDLLKIVDGIVAANGGQPYSTELFRKFQELAKSLQGQEEHSKSQISETVEKSLDKVMALMQAQLDVERDAHQETLDQVKRLENGIKSLENKQSSINKKPHVNKKPPTNKQPPKNKQPTTHRLMPRTLFNSIR